jgi:hypothetical protein
MIVRIPIIRVKRIASHTIFNGLDFSFEGRGR